MNGDNFGTTWGVFEYAVRRWPQQQVTVSTNGASQSLTFSELRTRALRLVGAFQRHGLRPGDRILAQLPHCPENLVLMLAAAAAGLVVVPTVHILGPAELRFILEQSQARLLVLPRAWHKIDYAGRARALAEVPTLEAILVTPEPQPELPKAVGWEQYQQGAAADPVLPPVDPASPCLMIYTSGTTSAPKGVMHSHLTLLAEARQVEPVIAGLEYRNVLLASPAGHIGPATALLRLFTFGMEGVFLDRWDAELAVQLIQRHGLGWGLGVPTFLAGLVPAARAGRIPTLKVFIAGGTSVAPALIEHADAAGIRAVRSYGSSEHPTVSQGLPDEPVARRASTDGRLCAGVRVRIVDDQERDLPPGEAGEIIAYGPEQFLGYFDPALNEAAFTPDGGFRTGDIGVIDSDGYLTIVDRKKDIIIRGGENLSSREIEEALARHPAILEAAAVAWPDARLGERVGAFLQLCPGASEPDIAELQAHFQALGLGRQKVPEYLVSVAEFPRNAYGKILKAELRKRAAALHQAAAQPMQAN